MRQSFNAKERDVLSNVKFLTGSIETVERMLSTPARIPFAEETLAFVNAVSKELMDSKEAKAYPDVVTLGFWLRRANLKRLEERYGFRDENIHLGRGIAFHIAPSNVPVNFAYSLFASLLMGNCNVVRVPSKDFPQIGMITGAIHAALEQYPAFQPCIALLRYGREKEINDVFSSLCDVRIIWGGDATIRQIRMSPLPPRSTEVTFADRYSLAVIDSAVYMAMEDKKRVALDFYNDTYLSDQNACTSPRLVVWTGSEKAEAKDLFWKELHTLVKQKYQFQPIMAVNKLTSAYLAAVQEDVHIEPHSDNLLVRVSVEQASERLMDLRESCGYFYEYDADNLLALKEICDDNRVQTIGIIGDKKMLRALLASGVKGIDRVVPIGHTMDFDLLWDGYYLPERLTRTIVL